MNGLNNGVSITLGDELVNTLIVFSSNHGELLGNFGSYGKRSMLEASCRVPMIARLTSVFPANSQCDYPTTLLDLFPTFKALAGNRSNSSRWGLSNSGYLHPEACPKKRIRQFDKRIPRASPLGIYPRGIINWKS